MRESIEMIEIGFELYIGGSARGLCKRGGCFEARSFRLDMGANAEMTKRKELEGWGLVS